MVTYGAASWFAARAQCESVGGHVVRLGNVTVYRGVVGQLQGAPLYTGQEMWTGLRRARWVWVTGELLFKYLISSYTPIMSQNMA